MFIVTLILSAFIIFYFAIIIITTAKGIVIRTSLENIRIMGRATQGVRIVKLQQGDYVTDLVKLIEHEEE